MADHTRDELLALTPAIYLGNGYRDASGQPRAELSGTWCVAAATQLGAAEMPAQEFVFTLEALRMLLEGQDGDASEAVHNAAVEALATVRRMIRQANNEGLVEWLGECVAAVSSLEDISALIAHMQAVARLYTVIVSLPEPDASSPPSSPSSSPAAP
jgi:hypothetical protein